MPGADGCWVRWRKAYSGPFSRLVDENFEGDTQRLTRGTYKLITLQHRIRREIEFKKRKKRERIYFWVRNETKRNETKQVSKAARQQGRVTLVWDGLNPSPYRLLRLQFFIDNREDIFG